MSPRPRGTRPSFCLAARRRRRQSFSCTAGRSFRSPGVGSLPCLATWAFARLRPTCVATAARAYIRATRIMGWKQSSPTCSSCWIRSGAKKAIWVGHDWGSPVVWSIAQHHPERCHGVANLCVPYIPEGFAVEAVVPLADRTVYPVDTFPAAQWDYQLFYRENFAGAQAGFESDVAATVRALFRAGDPAGKASPREPPSPAPTAAGFAPIARPTFRATPPCSARRTNIAMSPRSSATGSSAPTAGT